jgi:hypothetical protein
VVLRAGHGGENRGNGIKAPLLPPSRWLSAACASDNMA